MKALSIVSPSGSKIANGEKTIEVRSWKPTIALGEDLLIVENQKFLHLEGEVDPHGKPVALVKIKHVREYLKSDMVAACASRWEPGYYSWELENIRAIHSSQSVVAKRGIYEVNLTMEDLQLKNEVTMIQFREGYDPAWIDQIMDLHNKTEMKRTRSQQVGEAFATSFAVETAWIDNKIVACGRMISDGQMYSAIFDVVVDPDFQKRGIGKSILEKLIAKAPETMIHLTSTFGNEGFYQKLGFRKHKTAFALYPARMAKSPYLE